jgi:hypothetical protein
MREGHGSLSANERDELRSLFMKEARKGAFRPTGTGADAIRQEFCEHVVREFGPSVLTVIDALPYFRRKAKEQLGDQIPLASLLLFATWIEHWVNVVITMGMLRRGQSEADVDAYFKVRCPFVDRMAHLQSLCANPLPDKPRGWLIQVMKTRARYHHYIWKGAPDRLVQKDLKGIAALMRRGDAMIEDLLAFEHLEFDAQWTATSVELFPPAR